MSSKQNGNVLMPGETEKINGNSGGFFTKVNNPSLLISIVEKRLPISCFILNQLKTYEKFVDELEIYMYGSGTEQDTWILTKFYREDWELMISISAPEGPFSEDIKQVLSCSGVIEWDKPYQFTALQSHVSDLILNINFTEYGNIVTIYPCYMFHMARKDALQLEISPPNTKVTVKSLEPEAGTPFITQNWKYHNGKTFKFVRQSIERLPSGGVYVCTDEDHGEELVCGVITTGFGLISMLHTDPKHRRQGYAAICMKHIFRQIAREGLEPCLISDICNKTAVKFHHSMGLHNVGRVNYISHKLNI